MGTGARRSIHQDQRYLNKSTSVDVTRLYKNILSLYRRIGKAVSAILCQKAENGSLKPLAYECRALGQVGIAKYKIPLKKCLAILYGLHCFDEFLRNAPFVIRTDSRAITFMNKNEIMGSKLARWAVMIQNYSFVLEHVGADQNGGPDSLSRLRSYEDDPNAEEELEEFLDRKILQVSSNDIRKGSTDIDNNIQEERCR